MMTRCWTALTVALALCINSVSAATEDGTRIGNRTIERTVQLRTHSLYAPYIDQDLQNRWWDFGADSYVNTNKHIRLTRARPSQMGWLWSRLPITASNFVIEVEFKVSGDNTHLYGDGMAIWLTSGRATPGPAFGNVANFDGLGIFLDTYANERHAYSFPRVSSMHGNGVIPYDMSKDGEPYVSGACSANFRRTNVATKLKITYLRDSFLDVKIQYKAWDDWSDCFQIRDIILPVSPFLGFSAMTGDVHDAHDIISVTTYSAVLSPEDAPRGKLRGIFKPSFRPTVSSSTWGGFFFKVFLFAAVCAAAYFGWQQYQMRYGSRDSFGSGFGGGSRHQRGFSSMYNSAKRF